MAIKRQSRGTGNLDDIAWFAALIGDECPPGFSDIRFLMFQFAVEYGDPKYASDAREAWVRLRPKILAEWRRRRRTGPPPGALLDQPATQPRTKP